MRLIVLISTFCFFSSAYAMDSQATLDRSWGLLIGDQIMETIHLPVNVGELDPATKPQEHKRYGAWLHLQQMTATGQTLQLTYQLINVPAENRQVGTPAFEFQTKEGESITVPSLPMQIGSFLQSSEEEPLALTPRSDIVLLAESNAWLKTQLWLSLALLAFSSLVWLAWHFGLRPRQRLPFATAVFELNKMRLLRNKDSEAASRSLHHAFNRCAGRVVIHSQLDKLWQECPWLDPVQEDIAAFYQQSAAHFFSRETVVQKDFEQLLALARRCRAEEKMA